MSDPETRAEIKRRLMMSQAIQALRTKVQKIDERVSAILGNQNNPGGSQSANDTVESSSTEIDSDTVKEIVQQLMNDGEFTMQEHNHIDESQGGGAYASLGAALK